MTPQTQPGMTNSVPVNLGVGGGVAGAGNGATSATAGWETVMIGGVITLILAGLWELSWFKRQPVVLKYSITAAICIIAALVVFGFAGHAPLDTAIAKGCAMVLAGLADEFGVKISGITSMLPRTTGLGEGMV